MPRKGYRTICVTDDVYCCIQKKALDNNCSIPEYIKQLIKYESPKEDKH